MVLEGGWTARRGWGRVGPLLSGPQQQRDEREAGDWPRCRADSAKLVSCTFRGGCRHCRDSRLPERPRLGHYLLITVSYIGSSSRFCGSTKTHALGQMWALMHGLGGAGRAGEDVSGCTRAHVRMGERNNARCQRWKCSSLCKSG